MKNNSIWIALIAVALIAGLALGLALASGGDNETEVAGVYQAFAKRPNTSEFSAGTLTLKPDGTGYLDDQEFTWKQNENSIQITLKSNSKKTSTLEIVSDNAIRFVNDIGYNSPGVPMVFFRVG